MGSRDGYWAAFRKEKWFRIRLAFLRLVGRLLGQALRMWVGILYLFLALAIAVAMGGLVVTFFAPG